MKEKQVSWQEAHHLTERLARKIKCDFKPDAVIAISSGGLVPGKLLKEMLGAKVIGVISAHGYDNSVRRSRFLVEKTISGFMPTHVDQKVLVVDDIVETGSTLKLVLETLDELSGHGEWKVKTAALFVKPGAAFLPDYYELSSNEWIVFPWEAKEIADEQIENHGITL